MTHRVTQSIQAVVRFREQAVFLGGSQGVAGSVIVLALRHAPINMVLAPMKTTVEIPDDLFRRAKVMAAQEGLSMKQLITESLQQRVSRHSPESTTEPAWKRAFGAMRSYRKENRRIEKIIEQEFEQIEPEDRR